MGLFSRFLDYFRGRPGAAEPSPPDRQSLLNELARPERGRTELYDLYENYYEGEVKTQLPERAASYLERSGLGFTENFAETIIDTYANRLAIDGWSSSSEAAVEWMREFWEADEQREVEAVLHTNTAMLGDGVLAVEWDHELGAPALRWNHPRNCRFEYDSEGKLVVASKVWSEQRVTPTNPKGQRIRRLNLHFPGRIEKWFTTANDDGSDATWSMHLDPEDAVWPTPWLRNDQSSRGINLFHCRHRPRGKSYGRSKLRPVIPQQDLLDKQILDLVQIGDTLGWPTRWISGLSQKEREAIENNPGDLWLIEKVEARAGQLPAAELVGPLAAIDATLKRMAARSGTPLSRLLTGSSDATSGESKKMDETALVEEINAAHPTLGVQWAKAAGMCASLEADYGTGLARYDGEPIRPQWHDPQSRNEAAEAEAAEVKQRLGVSRTTTLEEMGYDPVKEAENRREESIEDASRREVDPEPALPGEIF